MEFHENVLGLIGNTPLVKLNRWQSKSKNHGKMNLNPGCSGKDRNVRDQAAEEDS